MLKILIDPGHGAGSAHNRGGVCFNEGDNNFVFSLILKAELEKYEGVQVDMTRKRVTDNPDLATRSAMGKGYDLFLSEHSNAANGIARGTEVWDSVQKPNKALAQAITNATAKAFNHNNRGVKYKPGQPGYDWYGVLRFNGAKSAMIIESGFHDNRLDCQFFKSNHKLLAELQAKAVADHYKLRKKGSAPIKGNLPSAPSSWAVEHWDWAKINGVTDGTRPKDQLSREEFVVMLKRIHDK